MSLNFDSENLVFVPAGARLAIVDVAGWRRIVIDTLGASVRMRPEAVGQLDMAVADTLNDMARRKSLAPRLPGMQEAAEGFLDALREAAGQAPARRPAPAEPVEGVTLWVRVSDTPAESFFAEDYDEAGAGTAEPAIALPVFGNASLSALEDLEIPFPARDADAAFELLLPREGLGVEPLPTGVPLPLVEEFCGALGVSARGNSINVTTQGELAPTHLGCTPVGRIGGTAACATLYFSLQAPESAPVIARLLPRQLERLEATLGRSHFTRTLDSPACRIHVRGGDVVQVYEGLDGKESLGVRTMPPFVVVATADGSLDPEARGAFLRELLAVAAAEG